MNKTTSVPEDRKHRAASRVLQDVVDNHTSDLITFNELKTSLHERGFGILMICFSLPLIITPPGVAAVMSIPILLISCQLALAFDSPWFPKWLGEKTIRRSTLAWIVEKTLPYLHRTEKLLRPRFLALSTSSTGERIIGIFAVFFSLYITAPLPFSNSIPALGITVMSLGLLGRDGLMILIGILIGIAGCIISTAALFYGIEIITNLFGDYLPFLGE